MTLVERVARAIANARSERRTPTARRARGGPAAQSMEIARIDAQAAIAAHLSALAEAGPSDAAIKAMGEWHGPQGAVECYQSAIRAMIAEAEK